VDQQRLLLDCERSTAGTFQASGNKELVIESRRMQIFKLRRRYDKDAAGLFPQLLLGDAQRAQPLGAARSKNFR
jgi:hypothetical protein